MGYHATIDICKSELFTTPFIVAILLLGMLCWVIISLCRILQKKKSEDIKRSVLIHIALMILFCYGLYSHAHKLKRGIYLPFEQEDEAIALAGTVDYIKEDSFSPRFFLTNETGKADSYGGLIVIDGKTYYSLSTLGWRKGDVVSFSYLPKSKIILDLEKQN